MAPKFGTSGLRGLVTELTATCVKNYVMAFASSCEMGSGVYVGHDLRESSPTLAGFVADAASSAGLSVTQCGAVPTPALALAAMAADCAAVMVTGSHIPADRNGLKFYTPNGEITKSDEAAILGRLGAQAPVGVGAIVDRGDVGQLYLERYLQAFGPCLAGRTIGVYAHSAVGRELLRDLLVELGAEVVVVGYADEFIPVDTEAVPADIRNALKDWASTDEFDAIISTDADGDRPLLTNAKGEVIPGDILGQITASFVGAETVVTPISSNTGVEKSGQFSSVLRTRIGSPFVISAMESTDTKVVGYEANGGFLLGFDADGPAGALPKLLTRDALLPLLACLAASQSTGLDALVAAQPARYTAADRLQGIPTELSAAFLKKLQGDPDQRATFLDGMGGVESAHNVVDGLRITLSDMRVVHLRPSGNAPEFRCYVEAETPDAASDVLALALEKLRAALG